MMESVLRIWALIIKEFHSVWRDPKSRSLLFLPPIVQLFLFSHAATLDIENITLAILNEDSTPVSREFTSRIEGSRYFKRIVYVKNLSELQNNIDNEAVRAGLYIKNDFTKSLKRGGTSVEVILDGRHTNGSQIIGNYIAEIASGVAILESAPNSPKMLKQVQHDRFGVQLDKQAIDYNIDSKKVPNINAAVRNWYNPNLYYHWFIISSLVGILSMSMVLLLSALSLAREKESGTFDQILVSPLRPYEIIIGKLAVPLMFGVIDAGIILLSARFVFKIPILGNMFLYFFALIIFLISILGVGLFISSLSKTQQQAILGVFVFMFPAMILSGYSAPVENITPQFLQNLTVANPLRFFLVISKGIILKDFTFSMVMLNLVPIVLISIFTLLIANFSFKNKLG